MLASKKQEDLALSFLKYAQALSSRFDINVKFDGVRAETDGTTITLPSLAVLNEEEVDFLYGALLHEIGHIKFTNLTLDLAKLIKSDYHFHLANAIEDARIENLLMNEYDGASAIFDRLYNLYATNPIFMKRIFKIDFKSSNFMSILGYHIHSKLINLKINKSIIEVFGVKSEKVIEFIADNQIDQMVNSFSLNSLEDSISLAEKIYNLITSTTKDQTKVNEISSVIEGIQRLLDSEFANFRSDNLKNETEITTAIQALADKQQKYYKFKEESILKADELRKIIEDNRADQLHSKSVLRLNDKLLSFQKKIDSLDNKIASKKQKVEKFQSKIKEIEIKAKEKNKTIPQGRLDKINNSIQKESEISSQLIQKLTDFTFQKKEYESALVNIPELFKKSSEDVLNQTIKKTIENIAQSKKNLVELKAQGHDLSEEIAELKKSLLQLKKEKIKKDSTIVKSLQSKIDKLEIDVKVIPDFVEVEGWNEANKIQKEFDQSAEDRTGKIVLNGRSNEIRDLVLLLDNSELQLKDFNVLDHFKKYFLVSKIEELNKISSLSQDGEVFINKTRRHVPVTTEFDTVHYKTSSSGNELRKIRKDNKFFMEQLTSMFRQKMKVQRREKFKGNKEDGSLDSRSLWKLATDTDHHYYEERFHRYINQVSATIAIDISGSMNLDQIREKRVKELVTFLSDALTSCHVRHEIVGLHAPISKEMRRLSHSSVYNRTSNSLDTVVYHSFMSIKNNGIENIKFQATDNSDGESLKIAATRLLRERSRRKIMFIITDGKPYLTGDDPAILDQDLRESLDFLRLKKIDVFSIGLNEQPKSFYQEDYSVVNQNRDLYDFLSRKLKG
jgi:outer membrane murein-binding lipoprotein Lpp